MALTTKRAIILFLSERHLSRKERNLYFLPCQMHQERDNKIVPFDYMKNGSHHKKNNFFCSFLNVIFLEKNVICTFCLTKCITKGQKNCSFWLHEEWLSPQKERFCCSFLNVVFLEKVICTFCLAKCIRKGQKKMFLLTTWRMALSTKRAIILFLSERHLSRKERNLYFLPCQMHHKRKKKILLTTWRMALSTKRAILLFLS